MKVTWSYDRGDQRDNHEVDLTDPDALETLLREIQQGGEPVVLTIFSDTADGPDDLPPGIQIGLGHPTHAFAVHIADDGGYLNDPTVETPTTGLRFDFGGVPTEYPAEYLRLRPGTAIQLAVAFLLVPLRVEGRWPAALRPLVTSVGVLAGLARDGRGDPAPAQEGPVRFRAVGPVGQDPVRAGPGSTGYQAGNADGGQDGDELRAVAALPGGQQRTAATDGGPPERAHDEAPYPDVRCGASLGPALLVHPCAGPGLSATAGVHTPAAIPPLHSLDRLRVSAPRASATSYTQECGSL